MHGFCHIELPCTDFAKIGKFYTDVFGWNVREIPEMNYAMFQTPDGPDGGFSKQAKIAGEPGIALYIEVEDIDAILKKSRKLAEKRFIPKPRSLPISDFSVFSPMSRATQSGSGPKLIF